MQISGIVAKKVLDNLVQILVENNLLLILYRAPFEGHFLVAG
jgi:hypothetical protein